MPRTGLLRISLSIFLIAAGIVSGSTGPALAQSSLANGRGNPAIQLRNAGRVRTISIAAIEALPQSELTGRVSPDEPVATCQGALLSDVVDAIGATKTDRITVRASDGYAADIPRKDWKTWPILVATRCSGHRLTVRQRGPARILYPATLYPELANRTYVDRSVWMIAEIEW
ncbi:MAG: hypothetical protein CMN87_07900 [Stappia sp.]|uniref:hypothetical protein n=1 Tax=Stappia sp. TaxID=1870903 RepID=UPI000C62C6EF|nr:hypothetical protein [Stappia sp.]MAB01060.1 hypothetical protein [Stappia sp.]MBM19916.1 hypothetical protein [Stappia sp.]